MGMTKEIVLVGGGHTHALFLRLFGMNPLLGVRVTLISDSSLAPYSGMVPALVEGRVSFSAAHIDLVRLAQWAKVRFLCDKVVGFRPETKVVQLASGKEVRGDVISLNTGIHAPVPAGCRDDDRCVPVKPMGGFLQWLSQREEQFCEKALCLVLVGGGAAGVELALAVRKRFGSRIQIQIIDRGTEILSEYPVKARRYLEKVLRERDISCTFGFHVVKSDKFGLHAEDGRVLAFDRAIFTSGGVAPKWIHESGLALSERGSVAVSPTLASCSHEGVFAVGDVADVQDALRPKAGVFAVRQAQPLYDNIAKHIAQKSLASITQQKIFLKLLGTADGKAVYVRGNHVYYGYWVRFLKDLIDRRFMRQFDSLSNP